MAKSSPIFLIVLLCSLSASAAFAQQNSGANSSEEAQKRSAQAYERMAREKAEYEQKVLQAQENARRNAAQNQPSAQQAAPNSNLRTPTAPQAAAPTAAAPTAAAPTAAAPTAAAPTAAAPTEFRAAWVPVKNGQVPANMLRGGDFKGAPLAICRTQMPDGLHPGKVWSGQCYIGYMGRETSSPNFDVLVTK